MFNNQDLLERIEAAERVNPFCQQCGEPTIVAERDNALWLECATLGHRRSRIHALLRLDFATLHTRRSIVELCAAA
ncbi:MAG TPA: hypothetical protein VHM48_03770 [Candidatus Limnocylindrales bacterium]|nr:hypothetical protein [Candidatus Limnocylindrales bacterium]